MGGVGFHFNSSISPALIPRKPFCRTSSISHFFIMANLEMTKNIYSKKFKIFTTCTRYNLYFCHYMYHWQCLFTISGSKDFPNLEKDFLCHFKLCPNRKNKFFFSAVHNILNIFRVNFTSNFPIVRASFLFCLWLGVSWTTELWVPPIDFGSLLLTFLLYL